MINPCKKPVNLQAQTYLSGGKKQVTFQFAISLLYYIHFIQPRKYHCSKVNVITFQLPESILKKKQNHTSFYPVG